jgi:hypothetical protein
VEKFVGKSVQKKTLYHENSKFFSHGGTGTQSEKKTERSICQRKMNPKKIRLSIFLDCPLLCKTQRAFGIGQLKSVK